MPQWRNREIESFNDGSAIICAVKDRALIKNKTLPIRFGNRTVGISRFYKAKIASDKVDRIISIPYMGEILSSDVVLLNAEQYKVLQVQNKFDTFPPCRYLSLERIVTLYADRRQEHEEK